MKTTKYLHEFIDRIRSEENSVQFEDLMSLHQKKWKCDHSSFFSVFKFTKNKTKLFGIQCSNCGFFERKPKAYFGYMLPTKQFDDRIFQKHWEEKEEERKEVYEIWREYKSQEQADRKQKWGVAYQQYLESDEWKCKRRIVLRRDNFTCQGCLLVEATDVHHLTYSHVGNELFFQLVSLCRSCHELVHRIGESTEGNVDITEFMKK